MRSRVARVAWTYTQPITIRIWACLAAMYLIWLTTLRTSVPPLDLPLLIIGGTLSAWFGAMVITHAKEQFASPRSALMPSYRGPHLLVASALLIAGLVILPLYIAIGYRALDFDLFWSTIPIEPMPFLTIVLLTAAAMMWIAYLQSPWIVAFAFIAISSAITPPGVAFFRDMAAGKSNYFAAVLLLMAVSAIVLLLHRMTWMTEEMPEYSRTSGPDLRMNSLSARNRFLRAEAKSGTSRIEALIRDAHRLDRLSKVFNAGFWRRVQHWRIVVGLGRTPIVVAALLALWTLCLPFLIGEKDREARFMIPIGMASMVPALMLGSFWPRRWYTLADESLRPATRNQFLLEQIVAMAVELAMNWVVITAACLGSAVVMDLLWPARVQATESFAILRATPILIAGQFLVFAATLWLLRFRSGWLLVILTIMVTVVETALLIMAVHLSKPHRLEYTITATAALAVTGLVILLDASRRWLHTDFD